VEKRRRGSNGRPARDWHHRQPPWPDLANSKNQAITSMRRRCTQLKRRVATCRWSRFLSTLTEFARDSKKNSLDSVIFGGRLESWWNFCTQERMRADRGESPACNRSPSCQLDPHPPNSGPTSNN
jgi:hypothetical protein